MEQQDWWEFQGTTLCNICQEELGEDRVLDHCHLCGAYRGACHMECNIQYCLSRDVPVILHNLRRYDGHLLLEKLGQVASRRKGVEINVIPKGFDDYLTFSLRLRYNKVSWNLRFIDSFQFLSTSLEKLVENLHSKGADKFHQMTSYFKPHQLHLLLRKGIYPYDYMDGLERFAEEALPTKASFRSTLTDQDVTDADYDHARNILNKFHCKNMGDYHDLYLTTDVLLLADVFENFRSFCLYNYQLDPAHYFTAPSFSWDACLKFTKVKLELLTDPEMYTFLEEGIRGGISTITHRYARANNQLVPDYDPSTPTSFIMYYDSNNLYGWTMTQPLPVSNFVWGENPSSLDVLSVPDDSDEGYVLEVDLDYPSDLHQLHNDYPLAAERLEIVDEMLSEYCAKTKVDLKLGQTKVQKLVPTLLPKRNYIIHYRNLKLYTTLGMRITQIHRVLKFQQRPWMAPYIDFNTNMRKTATSSFEKDLFKLFNNSVFGKTMENVRKYIDIKLVPNEDKVVKLAQKLEYNGFKELADSLWAVKIKRTTVKLCKPIYVGFTVLDLSKLLMYDFHYNYVKCKYGSRAKLLFTDTDSLCYHIVTDNVYSDICNDSCIYDCSDYPVDHICFSTVNKKVMGKFKDELNGVPIVEFVGLRAKMYSVLDAKGGEKKRAKGVKKSVVSRSIKHNLYKNVLFSGSRIKHTMNFIRSNASNVTSVVQNKTSLSAYDDKRYILDNAYSSYAYGHCNINSSSQS